MKYNLVLSLVILSLFFVNLGSALNETSTRFGSTETCFNPSHTYTELWTINNSNATGDFCSSAGFDSNSRTITRYSEGYITIGGLAYNITTDSVSNLTYISNVSSGTSDPDLINITFNNSANWNLSSNFNLFLIDSSANSFGDIYIWNYSSNSFKLLDSCIDTCRFKTRNSQSTNYNWSNDYLSNGNSKVQIQVYNPHTFTNFSMQVTRGLPTPSYAQNITLFFSDGFSYNYSIWNSTNFTEGNFTTINLTNFLKIIYPSGSGDVSFGLYGQGLGMARILNGSMSYEYTVANSGGGGITIDPTPVKGNSEGGGKVIIPPSSGNNDSWSMEFGTNIKRFDAEMSKGQNRTFNIQFENLGDSPRIITLTCEYDTESICKYIVFPNDPFTLQLLKDTKQYNSFEVNLPADMPKGNYSFNIIAKDDIGRRGALTVFLNVGILGIITGFISKLFSLNSFGIPYILIFLPVLIFSSIISARLLKKVAFRPIWVMLISLSLSILAINIF